MSSGHTFAQRAPCPATRPLRRPGLRPASQGYERAILAYFCPRNCGNPKVRLRGQGFETRDESGPTGAPGRRPRPAPTAEGRPQTPQTRTRRAPRPAAPAGGPRAPPGADARRGRRARRFRAALGPGGTRGRGGAGAGPGPGGRSREGEGRGPTGRGGAGAGSGRVPGEGQEEPPPTPLRRGLRFRRPTTAATCSQTVLWFRSNHGGFQGRRRAAAPRPARRLRGNRPLDASPLPLVPILN